MRKRTWSIQQLEEAVETSNNKRQVLGKLGLKAVGGNYDQLSKYLKEYNFSTAHFTGKAWSKGLVGIGRPRVELNDILVQGSTFQSFKLKGRLFKAGLKS
jgi:hypothetical protein